MDTIDGGIELLTPAAQAQKPRFTARGQKVFTGGWLILKPPYGIGNYTHTPSLDREWMERKGFRPIIECRVYGIERDIEKALRFAAENAKGFSQEERDHMRAAADLCAQNKVDRLASAAVIPETESERLARILSEGLSGIPDGIAKAVAALQEQQAATDEHPRGKPK